MATDMDIQGLSDPSCPPTRGMQIEMWPSTALCSTSHPRKTMLPWTGCAAIREFGFKFPVGKIRRNTVDGIALKAAASSGRGPAAMSLHPVILCDEWSEAQ